MTGMENGRYAYATCPFGKSIACSTPEAVSWDPEWEKSVGDISGLAVKNVHVAADAFNVAADGGGGAAKAEKSAAGTKASAAKAVVGVSAAAARSGASVRVRAAAIGAGRTRAVGGGRRSDAVLWRGRAFVGLRAVGAFVA